MREQSCSIPRGLKINKNSAEGEVFFVDFPSYRTLQAVGGALNAGHILILIVFDLEMS
jgi:hypothetical protein